MRIVGLALASMLALSGCVTAPHYVAGSGDYYYDEPRVVVDYVPDYFAYSAYYSALWPVYCPWWDAFCDSFHYGITYFPHRYFGFGYNYGFAYSPWYGSWWDSYYDWNWWHYHHQHANHSYRRFGSAQNEARAVAMLSRDASPPPRGASLRSAPAGDAAAIGGMNGATLRSRSAPLNGDEPSRRRAESVDERALDPYYGAPVRRSTERDDLRSVRRAPDSAGRSTRLGEYSDAEPARRQRFDSGLADSDDTGRPARRGDAASPRTGSGPRSEARQDGHSAPRQESPRFVPREPAGGFSSPAPAMRSEPAPAARSAPVSSPPARASRDDGDH